jgi:hypothetical protein
MRPVAAYTSKTPLIYEAYHHRGRTIFLCLGYASSDISTVLA